MRQPRVASAGLTPHTPEGILGAWVQPSYFSLQLAALHLQLLPGPRRVAGDDGAVLKLPIEAVWHLQQAGSQVRRAGR